MDTHPHKSYINPRAIKLLISPRRPFIVTRVSKTHLGEGSENQKKTVMKYERREEKRGKQEGLSKKRKEKEDKQRDRETTSVCVCNERKRGTNERMNEKS